MRVATVRLLITFFGVIVFGVIAHSSALDVDAQIEQIQNATPKERVKLMNELKRHLAQMNQMDRQAAIVKLQERMRSRGELPSHQKGFEHHNKRDPIMAHDRVMQQQMRANEQIHQMQHMNQMQGGNQLNHFQRQGGNMGNGGGVGSMPGAQLGSNGGMHGGMQGGGGSMFGSPRH